MHKCGSVLLLDLTKSFQAVNPRLRTSRYTRSDLIEGTSPRSIRTVTKEVLWESHGVGGLPGL